MIFWASAASGGNPAVMRRDKGDEQGTNLESVELHVGISVGEPLDHALDCFLGAILVARHLVAYFDDGAPVLRRQILVSRLGCDAVSKYTEGTRRASSR